MDAIKFIEERNRMCKAQAGCAVCPGRCIVCNKIDDMAGTNAIDIVKVVEMWSAAHPRKTRQDVFLEQWPEAKLDEDGIIVICPAVLSKSYSMHSGGACPTTITTKICADCRRKFWKKKVE